MSGAGKILRGVIGGAAGLLLGGKKAKPPAALLQPTIDQAARDAQSRDLLSKRRGAAANAILGAKGAESAAGKSRLGM